eukprot:268146_1
MNHKTKLLDIFKLDDQMVGLGCDNKSYTQCQSMNRLFAALEYYSQIRIRRENRNIFIDFVNDVYHQLIDDYIHFNNHHSHQLESIYFDTRDTKIFMRCAPMRCESTLTHFR